MRSLAEQIANKCEHYRGLQHDTCAAGVSHASVTDESGKGFERYPCFREGECLACDKRHFPTPEEVAKQVADIDAHMEQTGRGVAAARFDAEARGFKKGNGGAGSVKCPCCEGGTLHYSVAGYNGHMHGRCSTTGCVSWMQ